MNPYHKLDRKFDGKLRHYRVEKTKTTLRGQEVTFTEGIAYIDALFDLEIFDHLHQPNIVGIERTKAMGENIYILFEVLNARPMHYEMPSLTPEVPPVLKWEYLENIRESWYKGGENWMEIVAVHTGYIMRINEGELIFEKSNLSPLVGSKAHIMSSKVIEEMVCIKENNYSTEIGELIGYQIPLTIDIYSLFKYHTGIFGFTGSGKSNLISFLIRRILERVPELKIVILDISGEYTVHLIDILAKNGGEIYTPETITKIRFAETQVIPETLEEYTYYIRRAIEERTTLKHMNIEKGGLTLRGMMEFLRGEAKEYPYIQIIIEKMMTVLKDQDLDQDLLKFIKKEGNIEIKNRLIELMTQIQKNISKQSKLYKTIEAIIYEAEHSIEELEETIEENITTITREIVTKPDAPSLTILYIPEPIQARKAITLLIEEAFHIKKREKMGNKILFIIDEAQEFIPDKPRKEDGTQDSNLAVEKLLRQGRKYYMGGWIATQRIAHLNTNVLQQLHSYFISTLPRSYDRNVVADAFSISRSVVDKVTELDTGEWLFVSYKATRLKNIPIEITTPNNEEFIKKYLENLPLPSPSQTSPITSMFNNMNPRDNDIRGGIYSKPPKEKTRTQQGNHRNSKRN